VILAITAVGLLIPSISQMVLVAMNVGRNDFLNIFGLLADTSIGFTGSVMCPALYAIKLVYS
jgi:hypothetical protein